MIKKLLTKVTAVVLALTMLTSSIEGIGNCKTTKAVSVEKRESYIVQTVSEDAMEEVKEQYKEVETLSESAQDNLDNDIATVSLSKEEVSKLENSSETVIIEPDTAMSGSMKADNKRVYQKWDKNEDFQWNLNMIEADELGGNSNKNAKIKVAVVDSGIDFSEDIEVYERMNFVPNEDEVSPLYEDGTGHGTSVAGIIAAKENDKGITGVNENVELYSAKVLDGNNRAPISRVIEAINWAIEKKVNIINLSLGTSCYSEALHSAIKRATDKGILIVCAAGNGGAVEYPAAFAETLAVGSVRADGTVGSDSSVGNEIDVVAPGEQIMSTAAFDGVIASGGTSMAAPHVTGVAARLWEKNPSVDAEFIKKLICDSAKSVGDVEHYGNGIVDLKYAMQNYEEALGKYKEQKEKYMKDMSESEILVADNQANVECFDKVGIVEARWSLTKKTHENLVDQGVIKGEDLTVLKIGTRLPDLSGYGILGKGEHPQFHGYHKSGSASSYTNYIGYYYLLSNMAVSYAQDNYKDPAKPSWIKDSAYFTELCNVVGKGIGLGNQKKSWSTILKGHKVNARNKSLVLYGMAIHAATDAFAHSAVVDGKRLTNEEGDSQTSKQGQYRLASAKYVAKKMLAHIKNKKRGYVSDFAVPTSVTGKKFKMIFISQMAIDINSTTYKENKSAFDAMNVSKFKYYKNGSWEQIG